MVAEFYVVHNTANDASARNEIAYMIRNDDKRSYHYAIDDKEVVQGILESRNAWHAGDGGNGPGNRKGIGIEICYSKSGGKRFEDAEKNAAKFIAQGLIDKGWGIDKVKKHQDFSGKKCPHRTLDMGWDRFIKMIESEMQQGIRVNIKGKLYHMEGVFQNSKNYVGVRELAEALGYNVDWDQATKTVVIK